MVHTLNFQIFLELCINQHNVYVMSARLLFRYLDSSNNLLFSEEVNDPVPIVFMAIQLATWPHLVNTSCCYYY